MNELELKKMINVFSEIMKYVIAGLSIFLSVYMLFSGFGDIGKAMSNTYAYYFYTLLFTGIFKIVLFPLPIAIYAISLIFAGKSLKKMFER